MVNLQHLVVKKITKSEKHTRSDAATPSPSRELAEEVPRLLPSARHSFTHLIITSYSASHKPIHTTVSFDLTLEMAADASCIAVTIESVTDPGEAVTVRGNKPDLHPEDELVCVCAGEVTITTRLYDSSEVTAKFWMDVNDGPAPRDGLAPRDGPAVVLPVYGDGDTNLTSLHPTSSPSSTCTSPPTSPIPTPTAPPKKLDMAERAAAMGAEQEEINAKADMAVPDVAAILISSAAGAVKGTARGTLRSTVAGTLDNMKTVMRKTLRPAKRRITSTHLPSSHTATAILDHLLNLIPALHKMYARYDEVDAAMYVRERRVWRQVETLINNSEHSERCYELRASNSRASRSLLAISSRGFPRSPLGSHRPRPFVHVCVWPSYTRTTWTRSLKLTNAVFLPNAPEL